MKKNLLLGSIILFLFSAAIIIFQISCSQQAPAQTSTSNCIGPQPKFQFKANGVLYNCDAVFDTRFGWKAKSYKDLFGELPSITLSPNDTRPNFELSGNASTTVNDIMHFNFINYSTPSPIALTYNSISGGADCKFPNDNNIYGNSNHSITFTRVSNGTADGSFSGTVWTTSASSQIVTITDGVFSNIPVFNN